MDQLQTKPTGDENNLDLLAHLSRRLTGELIVYQSLDSLRRSSVLPPSTFSNIFSSETTEQIKLKFYMEIFRTWEQKFVQMVLVTCPRWPPCPYMVKTLQKSSSPEPEGR